MLAICSDLDETPDRNVYIETMRYLNTTETTTMGPGIGLETGNTIYFDMPPEQFSYWNTDERGREIIRTLIKSGHIDCLHSYGDLATNRAHVERALEELTRYNCKLYVWIDHGRAPSNFGQDIMQGQGDIMGSQVYHADITTSFGIKYVWLGRVTSLIGQNVRRSFRGIWNLNHPTTSTKTLLKEIAKVILSYCGNSKYALHKQNHLLQQTRLRCGHEVYEFIRSNPHWGGVSCGDTADGIAEVLVERMLSKLVKREGVCILYTHLGKYKKRNEAFSAPTRKALSLLAQYSHEKKILVTTTSRLLRYCRMIRELNISMSLNGERCQIDVSNDDKKNFPEGLSLYVQNPGTKRITINGHEVKNFQINAPDHTGNPSVSLPWQRLEFPRRIH
jgi:hypothetical protein